MIGKILKVKDINAAFNKKEKRVSVFACFTHVKYSDNYIIYADNNDYQSGILCYGTVYIKGNTIVIFDVKQDKENIIFDYVNKIINNVNDNEYSAIDISNMTEVEIISNSDKNVGNDLLVKLDELTIPKEVVDASEEENNESLGFLYFMLIIFLFLLAGSIYIYFNKDKYLKQYDKVICTINSSNESEEYKYSDKLYLEFDQKKELRYLSHDVSYKFYEKSGYNSFKYTNLWAENKMDDYKFNDNELIFTYTSSGKSIEDYELMTSYDEVVGYYKSNGYECVEEE